MVRHLGLVAVCVLTVGCGGAGKDAPPDARTAPPARAPAGRAQPASDPLLRLQRNGGATATLDVLTIFPDASATVDKRYGGAGRRISRFRLTAERMQTIRRALRRLPARPASSSPGDPTDVTFILRTRGRTYTAQQRTMTRRERALFGTLDGVISGEGRQ